MTEITDLSPTDASNASVTSESLEGNVANMGRMDNTLQAVMGLLARSIRTNVFRLLDNSDNTKRAQFNLTGPTATTNEYDLPYYGGTLAVASEMRGHIYGLTLSNNTTDATNDIDIAAGTAVDGAGAVSMVLASTLVKRLDAAWAVGTNQGGLDTGSIANTTYHVWLIRRSDTGVVDALFSASATAPTMPSPYDQKRRVGSILRESSTVVPFVQNGDKFVRKTPAAAITGTNPGTTAQSVVMKVPTGIKVEAILSAYISDDTASPATFFLLSDLDCADVVPSASAYTLAVFNPAVGGSLSSGVFRVTTNTSGEIRYRLGKSDADVSTNLNPQGWIDARGRN